MEEKRGVSWILGQEDEILKQKNFEDDDNLRK